MNTIFTISGVVIIVLIFTFGLKRAIRWLFSLDEILEKLDEIKKEVE